VERAIESPHTSESRRESDLGDLEVGLVEEALREVKSPSLGNRDRRRTHVCQEQSIEVSRADPQSGREHAH